MTSSPSGGRVSTSPLLERVSRRRAVRANGCGQWRDGRPAPGLPSTKARRPSSLDGQPLQGASALTAGVPHDANRPAVQQRGSRDDGHSPCVMFRGNRRRGTRGAAVGVASSPPPRASRGRSSTGVRPWSSDAAASAAIVAAWASFTPPTATSRDAVADAAAASQAYRERVQVRCISDGVHTTTIHRAVTYASGDGAAVFRERAGRNASMRKRAAVVDIGFIAAVASVANVRVTANPPPHGEHGHAAERRRIVHRRHRDGGVVKTSRSRHR